MRHRPLVTKHLGGHSSLGEHQPEQPLHVLEKPWMVRFGHLDENGVGKWLQITVKFPGMLSEGEQRKQVLSWQFLCAIQFPG